VKKNLLLLAGTSLVCLVLLEVVLRFASPPIVTGVGTTRAPKAKLYGWAELPSTRGHFIHPDTGKVVYFPINSQGWKDVEHAFEKPSGTIRILFLGDSGTFGVVSLEDLYTRQVERLLKDGGHNVEVISIGIGGWGTDQELEALEREGVKYQPDLVVYQFTNNDLYDNINPKEGLPPSDIFWEKPFKYELADGKLTRVLLEPRPERSGFRVWVRKLVYQSALLYNLNRIRHRRKDLAGLKDAQNKIAPDDVYAAGEQNAECQRAWKLTEALIVRMKEVAEQHGARFLAFAAEGEPGHRHWLLRWNRIHTDGKSDWVIWQGKQYPIDWQRSLKDLGKVCGRLGVPVIAPKREIERYEHDPHPNAAGNLAMAQDIVDFLKEWPPFVQMVGTNAPRNSARAE